mmetsp:Transcript_5663/g.10746  ORF Transcript_5663/g.10746 Transcript_5663/m.10746 type:complete len:284 (-) Transcript_5663:684-1535(-)
MSVGRQFIRHLGPNLMRSHRLEIILLKRQLGILSKSTGVTFDLQNHEILMRNDVVTYISGITILANVGPDMGVSMGNVEHDVRIVECNLGELVIKRLEGFANRFSSQSLCHGSKVFRFVVFTNASCWKVSYDVAVNIEVPVVRLEGKDDGTKARSMSLGSALFDPFKSTVFCIKVHSKTVGKGIYRILVGVCRATGLVSEVPLGAKNFQSSNSISFLFISIILIECTVISVIGSRDDSRLGMKVNFVLSSKISFFCIIHTKVRDEEVTSISSLVIVSWTGWYT